MRYPLGHKQRVRQRILTRAGRLFRRHGYAGVGIDSIMAAAGLTRGGFYGYFRSKADLLAQVIGDEHELIERLRARRGRSAAELAAEAEEIVGGYLHPDHRERIGRGCTLASLSVDVARAPAPVRSAYTAKLRELAGEFARSLPDAEPCDARALAAIALCVGGVVLARGVDDDALAERLLAACRERATRELRGEPGV